MGNETSVPEADGLQPPSQIAPEPSDATSMRVGGKAVKLAKAVLQKATDRHGGDHSEEKFYPAQEQYSPNSSVSSSQQYHSNGGPKSEDMSVQSSIPVMYASEGGGTKATTAGAHASSSTADKAANSIRTSGKAVRNSGRALINTMRNLTVTTNGSGSSRNLSASGTTAPRSGGLKKEENEWESNWDEDGEDDSSESDDDDATPPVAPKPSSRPPYGMSSSMPQQPPPPPMPTLQHSSTDSIVTPIRPMTMSMYEKPNVQMFLPLLRVLGKGSFGKVRYFLSLPIDCILHQ
jgi:hypothetical protein